MIQVFALRKTIIEKLLESTTSFVLGIGRTRDEQSTLPTYAEC